MMKYIIFLNSLLMYLCSCRHSPEKPVKQEVLQDKIMTAVVSEGNLHQEYIFKEVMEQGTLQYSMVYIGSVNTNKEIRKLLYETTLSGNLSPHANSHLILYDGQNNKLGLLLYFIRGGAGGKERYIVLFT